MPNGGSDCCGTCWFNRANEGRAGYPSTPIEERLASFCEIRDLPVDDPFYTYCANHPHRNPNRLSVPIGPVYTGDSFGNREPLHPSPDSEEIRRAVLALLASIPEAPTEEYPIGLSLETVIIAQVAAWGERRALPDLERIAAFRDAPKDDDAWFQRDQSRLKALAADALSRIRGSTS
jgi:hypothetical protein